MKGTALIYRPGKKVHPEVVEFSQQPTLEFLQGAVGGYIELVPHFDKIVHDGAEHRCRVLCNEHGKIGADPLPLNYVATDLWNKALGGRLYQNGLALDVLVGPIVVLIGDEAFMREL